MTQNIREVIELLDETIDAIEKLEALEASDPRLDKAGTRALQGKLPTLKDLRAAAAQALEIQQDK